MEAALNLCWIAVLGALCLTCFVARRRKWLRISLASALTCSLLLAVVLFPVISMTDDLQCAGPESEGGRQLLLAMLHGVPDQPLGPSLALALTALLMCLLAFSACVLARLAGLRIRHGLLPPRVLWYRPAAVRPPTLSACA